MTIGRLDSIGKPPVTNPDEKAHRSQIADWARSCLHQGGSVPFVSLRGLALSPTTLAVNTNDYDTYGYSIIRLDASAPINLTGIVGAGNDGVVKVLINVGANTITVTNQDVLSIAENRIITGTGAGIALATDNHLVLWYDTVNTRWRAIA